MAITITGVPAMLESKGRPYSTAHVTQLHALTGLRFIAALLVVLFHFEGTWRWDAFVLSPTPLIPITIRQALHNFSFNGFVGVNIFFILSGFVLAYNYLTPTNTLNGTRKAFWVARVARIYPVYLLGILFGAMPYAWNHAASAPPIVTGVSALTLVQAWQPYVGTAWNPPGWSLSAEIFFYMLFPFVAPWIARFREWFLYVLMIGCWCICLAVPLLYATLNPDHVRHPLDWNG